MRAILLLVSMVIIGLWPATGYARVWTQAATGRTLEADFVKVEGARVFLKLQDGRLAEVPISTLIETDQAFIAAQPTLAAQAANWPQFRGANQDGISPDSGLLKQWPSGGPKKLWTYDNAGMGFSGYSIAEGKLFTMGTRGSELYLIALSPQTGDELWAVAIGTDDRKDYNAGWGHGPRGAPSYSEGKVYGLGPKGVLTCLNAEDGSLEWQKDLVSEFGGKGGTWGYSESPLIDGQRLIVSPGGKTSLVALDKDKGSLLWAAQVDGDPAAEYASAVATELDGKRQYIKFFQKLLVGIDAESGEVVWQSDWPKGRTAMIPTPIVGGQRVYITGGYNSGSKLVEVNGTQAKDVWFNDEMQNHHGGVIKLGDFLYGSTNKDRGNLLCQSWETGEVVWAEPIGKGSVHVADEMLYFLNEENGVLTLAAATPDGYRQSGQFTLAPQSQDRNPKAKVWTHPVVIGGKLFLRDQQYIVCYNVKE